MDKIVSRILTNVFFLFSKQGHLQNLFCQNWYIEYQYAYTSTYFKTKTLKKMKLLPYLLLLIAKQISITTIIYPFQVQWLILPPSFHGTGLVLNSRIWKKVHNFVRLHLYLTIYALHMGEKLPGIFLCEFLPTLLKTDFLYYSMKFFLSEFLSL